MTNRVDELESQVAELQATVNGLTEELVETKERVRLLEESVEVDLTAGSRAVGYDPDPDPAADSADADPDPTPGGGADPDPLTESQAQTESRSQTETTADDANFIDADTRGQVASEAAADGLTGGDGTKSDGGEGDDEATTDDDIIVA